MEKRKELGTRSVNLHTHSPPVASRGQDHVWVLCDGTQWLQCDPAWREKVKHRHKHPWYKAVYYNKIVLMKRKEEGSEGKD